MTILHISDTHGYHYMIPYDRFIGVDLLIHSGDESNWKDPYKNLQECLDFIEWYKSIPVKHKIFVAGNHSTAIERRLIVKADFEKAGIIYLENEEVIIEGLKIYGSPYTPSFGSGWAFNKDRAKISRVWENIPDDTDILVTHGPPKGILDLSYNRNNELEFCGDLSLKKRIKAIQPKLVCFGHIHNNDNITNQGYVKLADHDTIYSNGSIVTDGRFGRINNNGNIFTI